MTLCEIPVHHNVSVHSKTPIMEHINIPNFAKTDSRRSMQCDLLLSSAADSATSWKALETMLLTLRNKFSRFIS